MGDVANGYAERSVLEAVHADFENIRIAWQFETERKNYDDAYQFLDGILHYADAYGRPQELIDLFQPVVTTLDHKSDDMNQLFQAQLMARIAKMLSFLGDHQRSMEITRESLLTLQQFDVNDDLIMLNCHLSNLFSIENDSQSAFEVQDETFALLEQTGHSKWGVILRIERAETLRYLGQTEEALALAQTLPDGRPRFSLEGHLHYDLGDYDDAFKSYKRANEYVTFNVHKHAAVYSGIFGLMVKTNQFESAWRYLGDALQFVHDGASLWGFLVVLNNAIELLYKENEPDTAVSLMSYIANNPETNPKLQSWAMEHNSTLETMLSLEDYRVAWENGKEWTINDVVTKLIER